MTAYRFGALVLTGALLAVPAFAQDAAGAITAESTGQAIGEAASGGQSVFVTAKGREVLPAATADADTVDDAVWDRVSQQAVTHALHEAQTLAKAAGRDVGDAEQITVLSKTVQGNVALLNISVRYLLK